MTYKELYLKAHPEDRDRIDEVMELYCPMDPSTGETSMCNYTSISPNLRCGVCWNQEIHETCSCYDFETDRCNGTKERDECTCGGDKTKCDFYPEKRAKAAEKSEIQERGFKAKELVPIGEEISKGIEQGVLEPNPVIPKEVADGMIAEKSSVKIGDPEELKNIENDEKVKALWEKHVEEAANTPLSSEEELRELFNNIEKKVHDELGITDVATKHLEINEEAHKKLYEEWKKQNFGKVRGQRIKANIIEDHTSDIPEEVLNDVCASLIKDVEVKSKVEFTGVTVESIKDSGTRREFFTGAVRDIQEGKGRCDLMPLDVISEMYTRLYDKSNRGSVFLNIDTFKQTGAEDFLYDVLTLVSSYMFGNDEDMFLEVAKHFEAGATKYGEYNWQKGIPTHCYIDSAVRHYLKFLRGDKDEAHNRAFVWNILCCIWTCKHKPELNDYPRKEKKDE